MSGVFRKKVSDTDNDNPKELTRQQLVVTQSGGSIVNCGEEDGKPSNRVNTLSKQQKEGNDKLRKFVEDFVLIYEQSLSKYYERLEKQRVNSGKWASFVNAVVEIGKGGTEAVEPAEVQASSIVGINILQKIISGIGNKHNRDELKKLIDQLYAFKKDPDKIREELIKSGLEVFQNFEFQFTQVTAARSWQRAMTKLAEDAVGRVVDYHRKNIDEGFSASSISKGIILGKSKTYKLSSTDIPHIQQGHSLKDKDLNSWNTADLFDKAGLVTIKNDGTADKYYKRKDGSSNTSKYGYRLLFKWESEDLVGLAKKLNVEYQVEKPTREEYKYISKPYEREELKNVLLSGINGQDPKLVEERLAKNFHAEIEYVNQIAEENFNELVSYIDRNFSELLSYIDNNQNEIKDIINKIVRPPQEIEDVKESKQGVQALLSNKEIKDKDPIWFDVRESVISFTALSLGGRGRQDKLDQVAANMEQGMVLISGLPGMGKSELAIKYGREHSKYYEGNVIWINSETNETIIESLRRLAMEELGIPMREETGDQMQEKNIKSIVKDIYKFFSKSKSLFIFDNAEKYDVVKEFLPLGLPTGSSKPDVLITSNNLEWESTRVSIKKLVLEDFEDTEAMVFVKEALGIENDLQNEGIANLVKKLHCFPLALQQAVAYIKEEGKKLKNIDPEKEFKVNNYVKEFEEKTRDMLKSEIFQNIGDDYNKTTFTALQVALDKVKNNEKYGQQALEIINIIAYFSSNDIPVKIFLELTNSDERELGAVIQLLKQYSIVRQEGYLNVHGLVRQVRRLELEEQQEKVSLEETTLEKGLGILKKHIGDRNSMEGYKPHIISAWNYASKYDKLIESFIVKGINDETAYTTYFHLIAEGSSFEVVEDIINKIENNCFNKLKEVINAKDRDRGTPLHNAALSGDGRIVKLLIEKGANASAKKEHSWTPLHLASKNGYLEVVKVLLDNNAKVSDKTGYKYTSLHLAARNGYSEVVKFLLDKGADVNAQDKYKYTPLHFAVKNNHFEVIQALLEADKINVNAETEHKLTPMHFAARAGYIRVVKILLEKCANVNITNKDNFVPLHQAALNGYIEIVNELLENIEIDINAQTTKGNTPLHLAAEKGYLDVIKALIALNADANIKNKEGKFASHLANENDHTEVKNCLIQHENKRGQISQIEQTKYSRKPGTSGIGRQLYVIELLMLFLLQGVAQKEDKKIDSFYLATNMKDAGDFDDVVFKYKYNENGLKKSKIVFLLAKHKETENKKKITIDIDTLLSKSEKGDFLLRKYLSSYRKIKQLRLKGDHPIFNDDVDNCDFVIYTNAAFNFAKSSVEEVYVEPEDILNLEGNSQGYYKLNVAEKVMDSLRHSLDFEILVRELAQSVCSGSIDQSKAIFKDYQVSLVERVIEKKNEKEAKLREEFLNDEEDTELSTALFEEIKKKEEFVDKSVDELKEELKRKNIQLPSNFGSAQENNFKLPLPSKLFSDVEIKEFLSVLKLFVKQPNERELGDIIKQKIQLIYKVEQDYIDTVFSDVEYKVRNWWREGDVYITESNTFFQQSARASITFDVKQPVALFTGRIRELEYIHSILQDGGASVISQMVSVTGLGGIGKSELARKYISEHKKDYHGNIIWINADNYLTTAESFRRLAQDKLRIIDINGKEKDMQYIIRRVYDYFAKRRRRSLFVFDNAGKHKALKEGEQAEGIDQFLPFGPNKPHILITSRDQEWGEIKLLPLGVFTEEEANEYIKKELIGVVALEESDIKRLSKILQYLPLALRQAVDYIKLENQLLHNWQDRKFTIGSYLEQFKEKAVELLSRESSETHDRYTKTVITTWQITIDKIKQRKLRGGKQALQILDILAYLGSDRIPVDEIFSNLISDVEVRHSAVELLDQYSMVYLEGGKLNIHRLVQQVTRIQLEGQGKKEGIVHETFLLLQESFPCGNDKSENYIKKQQLLPHCEELLLHMDDWIANRPEGKQEIENKYIINLLIWMSDGLRQS